MSANPFRLTIIHPCIGRHIGMTSYIKTWKMEPIPAAMVAAMTPSDVEVKFYDDRLESIPYDEPTDLAALSVETYTAKRCYQIASEYRARNVPVVMGGFHATLCPDEVREYCETIVIGEAETTFPRVLDDYRHGRPEREYRATTRPTLNITPDRSLFRGKDYQKVHLVEFARGCRFKCDFCAIQSAFDASHSHRPIDRVIEEVSRLENKRRLIFFIDDNITSNLDEAKALMRALIPLKVRWISQSAINVAFDDEALELMKRSGCQGLLVGFESLDPDTLRQMKKGFNMMNGGAPEALVNFRRFGLRIYGTFIFGYDHDTTESFDQAVEFALDQGLAIAAFNHITPFPGTPLYDRLENEGRLLFDPWWLDDRYRYNMIPFKPANLESRDLEIRCIKARRDFYSWPSILRRAIKPVNLRDPRMLSIFLIANYMHQRDIEGRNGLPLGDLNHHVELTKSAGPPARTSSWNPQLTTA